MLKNDHAQIFNRTFSADLFFQMNRTIKSKMFINNIQLVVSLILNSNHK